MLGDKNSDSSQQESKLDAHSMAVQYARDAIGWARENFDAEFDYTPRTIKLLDDILDRLHNKLPKGIMKVFRGPSRQQVGIISRALGCYFGESIRRRCEGEWEISGDLDNIGSVILNLNGSTIYPESRVYKRIMNGPEDSLWALFQFVCQTSGKSVQLNEDDISDDPSRDSSLLVAASNCNLKEVVALLGAGANPNYRNARDRNALHNAVLLGGMSIGRENQVDVVLCLLAAKVDINAISDCGTPLHIAVQFANIEIVKTLLDHGADPKMTDESKKTPLDVAIEKSKEEMIQLLNQYA